MWKTSLKVQSSVLSGSDFCESDFLMKETKTSMYKQKEAVVSVQYSKKKLFSQSYCKIINGIGKLCSCPWSYSDMSG